MDSKIFLSESDKVLSSISVGTAMFRAPKVIPEVGVVEAGDTSDGTASASTVSEISTAGSALSIQHELP